MYDCVQYPVMASSEFFQGSRGAYPSPMPASQFFPQYPGSDYDRGRNAGMGAVALLCVLALAGAGCYWASKKK